jgi:hypothetical protein
VDVPGRPRVAELNDWRYDSDSQFWHVYRLFPVSPRFDEVGLDPNRWQGRPLARERATRSGSASRLVMGPRGSAGTDLVAIRSVHIPESVFHEALRRVEQGPAAS